ncbi:MAG TPA: glycoside hydrolase family 16 protein [Gemmatimonadaceae bacterium]|nr:glycoside hydrolase family 16 protein [Gemmatimonadaceae bacterium]
MNQAVNATRTLALSLLGATVIAAGCMPRSRAPAPPGGGVGADAARGVLFFDDFSGRAVDRGRWNVEVRGKAVNDEEQAYVDSPETMFITRGRDAAGASDGAALVIRPRLSPGFVAPDGVRHDFLSAHLDTHGRFDFTYGTAAARMKLPAGAGLWPAFWILGAGDWPATGEIDVMENVGAPDWTSVALHGPGYSGDTPLVNRYYFPRDSAATAWHVYAVDWWPDSLVFRVDGAVAYRADRIMVEHHGRWAYDNPKYLILNLALGGAYPAAVNGVRAPYLGLPDATVERIRRGEADVLVDWVRVTALPGTAKR